MMENRISILRKNLIIQYVRSGILYGSFDHFVWRSIDKGKTWQKVCEIRPNNSYLISKIRNKILRSKCIRNIRRNVGINNVVVLKSGTVIIQYDKIYRWDGSNHYAEPVFDLASQGIAGPLKNGLAYDEETDNLYFGEYKTKRPSAIRVFCGGNDGRDWNECYEFPPGRIRHIHGIIPDPFRKRLWICTGDSPSESGLFFTDDGFRNVDVLGIGSMTWRMVSLIPTEEALYWGTDAGGDIEEENFIYKYDFQTNKLVRLVQIKNPAYYSARTMNGDLFIATTFEPHKQNIKSKTADLWQSKDGNNWNLIKSLQFFRYTRAQGTKYGTIIFPVGVIPLPFLLLSFLNIKNLDCCTAELSVCY